MQVNQITKEKINELRSKLKFGETIEFESSEDLLQYRYEKKRKRYFIKLNGLAIKSYVDFHNSMSKVLRIAEEKELYLVEEKVFFTPIINKQ